MGSSNICDTLMQNKLFALVDCNNFYASCERVFNPALENKPIVVLSNNDGCIVARSREAKRIGISMAAPVFKCEALIKKYGVHVFSSNYALYGDMSRRIMDILSEMAPVVEVYSIDEAFLDLKGFSEIDLNKFAIRMRKRIRKWTGIPVSIGIGPTKTLAKLANHVAKKNPSLKGVFNITDHPATDKILDQIKVDDIWGVGRKYAYFLNRHCIYTALQLRCASPEWVKKNMTINGLRTVSELQGISSIPIDNMPAPKKGITSSRSFGIPVRKYDDLREALSSYVVRAAEKLRSQSSVTSAIYVFVGTNRFKKKDPQYSNSFTALLPVATSFTPKLIKYACECLKKIYRPGYLYKKTGVIFTEIVPASGIQQSLFDINPDEARTRRLMEAVDKVNGRLGRDTLRYAATGINRIWKMKRELCSPRYTTCWHELPVVSAS